MFILLLVKTYFALLFTFPTHTSTGIEIAKITLKTPILFCVVFF